MKKRSELFFRLVQVPLDYVAIVMAFATAYIIRSEQAKPLAYLISGRTFLRYLLPLLVLWLVVYAVFGLYELKANRSRLQEFSRVLMASAVSTMLLVIVDFFTTNQLFPSKSIPIYALGIAVVFVITSRFLLQSFQQYLFRYGVGTHNVGIIGSGASRFEFEKSLKQESKLYNVVLNTALLKSTIEKKLTLLHKKHNFDDIFLIEENIDKKITTYLLAFCRQNQIQLHIVPTLSELYDAPMHMGRIKNIPVLEILSTPLEGWGRILKRIIDLTFSVILLIVLSPLFAVIAVILYITDRGPIFYAHTRLTRSAKKIHIFKFRTMQQKYCTGGEYGNKTDLEVLKTFGDQKLLDEFKQNQKVRNDPRVSRFGAFLRTTSLDELPQLFNIFRGNLSFVGPRPIVADELSRYGDESGLFLHIKPGLTGLWQVSGRNSISYDDRVKLDIYYIENWSLGLDIAIIIKTIPLIFRKSGY